MKNWGIFFMMLTASCVWNSGFGEAQLLHIKKAEDTFASCLPIGISADGTTAVGRAMDGSNWEAFRWNPNHSADPFKILEPKAGAASTGGKAYDVSGDGSIVVGEGSWEGAEHSYPKIWIDDVAIDFNSTFGGPAYAISDDGQVIATTLTIQSQYYVHWQIPYAHRWEIPSTFPPDYNPTVEPYSSDFTSMPMYEPPIYTPGSDYTGSRPAGISGDGNVLVGTSDIHLSGVAVRWYNEPGLGWMVEEFETYDKNRGTSAVAASYDGKVIVGNTLFNFGTEDVPTWETRGFAWPYENRKLYIWGTTALYESYSDVTETPSLVQVAAGAGHTVGLQENGEVLAWGVNGGPPIEPPDGLNDAIEIDAGYQHAIALKSDKTVVAWGNNDFGQATVPEGLNSVNAIAAGQYHNLALKEDGTVVAWGKNDDGQTDVPQDLGPVKDISAGYGHSLALLEDGSLVGWGLNDDGQASDPGGLENLVAIESGYYHNLSLD